ncbi:MBL fold metallo-hydrolase [Chloroflexota bacterium]
MTDPYPLNLGASFSKHSADIVTISHQHTGHSCIQTIGGNPRVVTDPGEYEICGVLIIGIPTFHDNVRGEQRGKNTVYLMEMDEVAVCHLGDLGHTLTAEQVEELGDVDVLLLPVGGVSTIDAAAAAAVVRRLEPKIVVPMHYHTQATGGELEPVDKFLKEIGAGEVSPQPRLSATKSNLPDSTRVVLLEP